MFDDMDESQSGTRFIPAPLTFHHPDRGTKFRLPGSKYTDKLAQAVCKRLMNGSSLVDACKDPNLPSKETVIRWLSNPRLPHFREMYYHARRVAAELRVDEMYAIADDTENDWIETYNKKGEQNGWKPNAEAIGRSRLKIDLRKWHVAKLIPRIYGEKVDVTHEVVGDLAEILKLASNKDNGLPKPINEVKSHATKR